LDRDRITIREIILRVVEVNQGVVILKLLSEDLATLLVQLVVSHVQRQEGGVLRKELEHLSNSPHFLSIHSKLVAFKIQKFNGPILLQSLSKLTGSPWTQQIALKFKLSKSVIGQEHSCQVISIRVGETFPAHING